VGKFIIRKCSMENQLKVLFVDDEPNILNGLKRMLRSLRNNWQMTFVESGEQALQMLNQENYNVVFSDMRMPGMNGAELLLNVQKKHPEVIRIILSGHTEKDMILKSVKPAHQYLSKPCDAETIVNTVKRANALRELLHDEKITKVVSNIDSLPSLPTIYTEMMTELSSINSSLQKVGQIISKDVGMTAKILQLVNSSFFGLPRHISNPAQAVSLLGIETIKSLVLSAHIFSQFSEKGLECFSLEKFRNHSLYVAFIAKEIAKKELLNTTLVDETYMAGILHDAGKIVFASGFPELYLKSIKLAQSDSIPQWQAEKEVFGTSHSEVGAYLLGLWGLSDAIVEAIAFHHRPLEYPEKGFSVLSSLYFANQLEHTLDGNNHSEKIDQDYLVNLKKEDQLEQWQSICANVKQNGN
jgi:putative nucleotidyltransferase with HDIG domain